MVEASDAGRPAAAKMRQTGSQFVPGEAVGAREERLDRLRPWEDERGVSRELREWAERYWPPSPAIPLGTADVAALLRKIGPPAPDDPDPEAALGLAFHMLR